MLAILRSIPCITVFVEHAWSMSGTALLSLDTDRCPIHRSIENIRSARDRVTLRITVAVLGTVFVEYAWSMSGTALLSLDTELSTNVLIYHADQFWHSDHTSDCTR